MLWKTRSPKSNANLWSTPSASRPLSSPRSGRSTRTSSNSWNSTADVPKGNTSSGSSSCTELRPNCSRLPGSTWSMHWRTRRTGSPSANPSGRPRLRTRSKGATSARMPPQTPWAHSRTPWRNSPPPRKPTSRSSWSGQKPGRTSTNSTRCAKPSPAPSASYRPVLRLKKRSTRGRYGSTIRIWNMPVRTCWRTKTSNNSKRTYTTCNSNRVIPDSRRERKRKNLWTSVRTVSKSLRNMHSSRSTSTGRSSWPCRPS